MNALSVSFGLLVALFVILLLYKILKSGIEGHTFDFYILSAAPVEVIHSALEDIVPPDQVFGTVFRYTDSGEIDTIVRAGAGYGITGQFIGTQFRFTSTDSPWAGSGVLERAM